MNVKIFFLILIYFITSPLFSQQDKLSISIEMSRLQYVEGEEVFLVLTYKNNTDSVIDYSISNVYENFDVINKLNKKMPFRGNYLFRNEIEFLKPKEEKKFFVNLTDSFAPWGKYTQMYRAFSPGMYEVLAFHKNTDIKEYYVSNTITFEVVKPDSSQLLEFKELKRMYRIEVKKFGKGAEYYRSFLLKYPTSIYSHRVIKQFFMRGDFRFQRPGAFVLDAINIIYKNPDSYSIYYPIKYVAETIGWIEHNHEKAYEFLNDIYERFKGYRASEEAQKYRDSYYRTFD